MSTAKRHGNSAMSISAAVRDLMPMSPPFDGLFPLMPPPLRNGRGWRFGDTKSQPIIARMTCLARVFPGPLSELVEDRRAESTVKRFS
jgi:hypothetical protein